MADPPHYSTNDLHITPTTTLTPKTLTLQEEKGTRSGENGGHGWFISFLKIVLFFNDIYTI